MKNLLDKMDAVLIHERYNVLYFTSYDNPCGYALFMGDDKYYFTNGVTFDDASANLSGYIIADIAYIGDFVKKHNVKRIGIESTLEQTIIDSLLSNGVETLYNVDARIQRVRAIKTEDEIELIKKAQSITDEVFPKILNELKEGITEIELAEILENMLYSHGGTGLSFESIVAFDKNTCMPHAVRSENTLKNGSLVTMDFGAMYNGYCSDMTRTVAFGNISDEQKKIYQHVYNAQDMALSIAHIGMTGKECDSMSRMYFAEYGLDKYFVHTLGHGLGIEVHEYPRLSQKSNTIMEENMVVTFEPGLYFEDYCGVRIEDLCIFSKNGLINLTKSPKRLIII